MRVIAFTGPKTCGKDTAAKYLLARNSLLKANLFEQVNYADTLKNACSAIFALSPAEMNEMPFKEQEIDRWPFGVPREHLIRVAQMFRTFYGGDIFVKAWSRRAKLSKARCLIVTDLRHTEELDDLNDLKAIIVYVQNDKAEALLKSLQRVGDMAANDASEASYELMRNSADVIITNNGSIADLHKQVSEVALRLLGDWTLWDQMEPVL